MNTSKSRRRFVVGVSATAALAATVPDGARRAYGAFAHFYFADRRPEFGALHLKSHAPLMGMQVFLGAAGTEIPLTVAREGSLLNVRLQSADRNDFLKKPLLH